MDRYFDIETQTKRTRGKSRICGLTNAKSCWLLMLITLLLLFTTTWVALFLSKQVTVPIQALAEATREIRTEISIIGSRCGRRTNWARWCGRSTE